MNKFRNKYRIPSARLIGYDYGSHGFYYVTICAKDKIWCPKVLSRWVIIETAIIETELSRRIIIRLYD